MLLLILFIIILNNIDDNALLFLTPDLILFYDDCLIFIVTQFIHAVCYLYIQHFKSVLDILLFCMCKKQV